MIINSACIAISFDREVMETVFSQAQTANGLISAAKGSDIFVALNNQNANILSLEHSLGYSGGHTLTVELIDLEKSLERTLLRAEGNRVYVTYGASPDLRDWAKPMSCIIANANLSIQGSRQVTIKLVPTNEELNSEFLVDQYGVEVAPNDSGLYSRYLGSSRVITFNNNNVQYQDGEFNYHQVIIDTLRDYVSKVVGSPNIAIVLPDINKVCANAIQNTVKNTTSKVSQVRKVLAKFGIQLELITPNETSVAPPAPRVPVGGPLIQRGQFASKFAAINDFQAQEFRATLDSDARQNPLMYVNRVMNAINRLSSDYKVEDYRFGYEVSLDIINYWNQVSQKSWTLGGYDSFVPGESVIVLGDSKMIRTYLYGYRSNLDGEYLFIQDSSTFTTGYEKDILEIQFPPRVTGDDFAILPPTIVEGVSIPEFKYNTGDSNVLSLRFKSASAYFALLSKLFIKTEKQESLGLQVQQKPEPAANSTAASGLGQEVFIPEREEIDASAVLIREATQAFRKGIVIELDTLPNFALSRLSTISSEALVTANSQSSIGYIGPEDIEDQLVSGFYTIIGFRHTIRPDSVLSQFQLIPVQDE